MSDTSNPKLFRELNEPFESAEEMNAAFDAFQADLSAAREKHGIPNVYCVLCFSVVQDGEEVESMTSVSYGDSLRRQPMTAWAYGRESADHDSLMRRIVADAMKHSKK